MNRSPSNIVSTNRSSNRSATARVATSRVDATRLRPVLVGAALVALLVGTPLASQQLATGAELPAFVPGAVYDPAVPSVDAVLGHAPGERIVSHAELVHYFETLVAATPKQSRLWTYGRTWEGRPLIYVAIGSSASIARLDAIRAGMQELADPRITDRQRAARHISELPALVWLAYGVHGNEISSPDAAMVTAHHLLAAQDDPVVEEILAHSVVLIDPSQNPDGRDRFVQSFRSSYGIQPDPDRLAAEHDEPWPQGRTNHYLFDLNRDWFALTQVETRAKVELLQQWLPLVFVDLHEMGGDSSYYFAPAAEPYNPHLTGGQRASLELFGRNNARWFDAYGFDYFVGEIFDAFYPGYGDSWPAYFGAVAMTYEQASPRGLAWRRSDGALLTFRDAIHHHVIASLATAETAARNREKLLRDFYDYRASAIEEGRTEANRTVVLPRQGDAAAVDKLAALLAFQGIELRRSTTTTQLCGQSLQPGSYAIDLAQPAKRLVRNLLDPEVPMDAEFLAIQEHRRRRDLPDQIYDVTAWSLPLMFNVPTASCDEAIDAESFAAFEPAAMSAAWTPSGVLHGAGAKVAYLAAWSSQASGRLLARALREELTVWSSDAAFTLEGRYYPAGSLIFKVRDNGPDLQARLERLALDTGAAIEGTNSSWVEQGPSLGSDQVLRLRAPRIALAWDAPTAPTSAGAVRYILEQQFGYPVTIIRTTRLLEADLRAYQVLILPDGNYQEVLDAQAQERLDRWVRDGGTLIAIGRAIAPLSRDGREDTQELEAKVEALFSTRTETIELSPTPKSATADSGGGELLPDKASYREAIRPASSPPDPVAGALLRVDVDQDHWLAAGAPERIHVLYTGTNVFRPVTLDQGVNVALFAGVEEIQASGHLWQENAGLLAFKPLLLVEPHGRGLAIGFTSDPAQRAYQEGLNLLLLNAIFRGPAHAEPQPAP